MQSLSELSVILQIVKAAIQALLYKVFHTKLVVTFPVENCREDPVIYRLTVLPIPIH